MRFLAPGAALSEARLPVSAHSSYAGGGRSACADHIKLAQKLHRSGIPSRFGGRSTSGYGPRRRQHSPYKTLSCVQEKARTSIVYLLKNVVTQARDMGTMCSILFCLQSICLESRTVRARGSVTFCRQVSTHGSFRLLLVSQITQDTSNLPFCLR